LTLLIGALAVWSVTLRPESLGGPSNYVIVHGDSMLPTYQPGDLLLVMRQPAYAAGQAVAYRVPENEIGAGRLVVHRITGGDANGFELIGDNNPAPDPWHPSASDVAGRVELRIPGVGSAIAALLQPAMAGAVAAAIVVMMIVGRPARADGNKFRRRPTNVNEPPAAGRRVRRSLVPQLWR
jgi:signal peptidase